MPVQNSVLVGVAILAVIFGRVAWLWMVYRRQRLITCPENRRPAGVRLDARLAAVTLAGKPHFRLSACTRWPERAGCGQECLGQIEAAPHDCEVRQILSWWYQGRQCANCGTVFSEILWEIPKPALLQADKTTVDWEQIPVDQLPEALEQSKPICFACHMAGKLVREHPELAVERTLAERGGQRLSKT